VPPLRWAPVQPVYSLPRHSHLSAKYRHLKQNALRVRYMNHSHRIYEWFI
jgi:hypothetical protein